MTDAETQVRPEPAGAYPILPRAVRERLVQLDPAALEQFFDAFFDRIYGYVRRLVASDHLAEDLTQDIFLHLHQALPKYDPERDLRPWVFTIATNKIRDYWRSRRHRDSLRERSLEVDEDNTIDLPAATEAPDHALTREEIDAGVREAIEELPDGLRVTLVMRVYEGMSFEEIGAVLERNEVAIRKRYSRALEVLRDTIGRQLTDGGR
jgi:RNA polymerase sigma-70 factor (ECF subfamily)